MVSSCVDVCSGILVDTTHSLFITLCTCVSTATQRCLYNTYNTTFAVLIPTPGNFTISCIVSGIRYHHISSTSFACAYIFSVFFSHDQACKVHNNNFDVLKIFFALPFHNPIVLISCLNCFSHIFSTSLGSLIFLNNSIVTLFTCLSVVWALIMTAIKHWNGVS